MKKYEVMYIIRPNVEEEPRKALMAELEQAFLNNASEVLNTKEMGLRDLAYEIDGEKKGFYVLVNVNATPQAVKEFERLANIKEAVIRHIVVAE